MNGSVPDPDWFDDEVLDTNSACPDAEFGDRDAVAPLTAALETHDEDFAAIASVTQGGVVQDFSPDDALLVQVVVLHDFPPDDALLVQVVVVHDFPPDAALVSHDVVVHVCPPDAALAAQDVDVVQLCPPDDPLDAQVEGGLPPPLVPPGGVEEPPGDPDCPVVGDVGLQPVWAGFVLPIP